MNNQKKDGKCIVIGAGDLTVNRLDYDSDKDYLIAVDGGLMYCQVLQVEPDLIIGDFDSVTGEWKEAVVAIKEKVPEKVEMLVPEKDDTDMYAALKKGLEAGFANFITPHLMSVPAVSVLMGEKVEPRREFIEQNAVYVTNLDV